MKQTPELQRIQDRMQPGSLSSEGFLGEDSRNLADILAGDQLTVDRLGASHKVIADRMRYFTQKGAEAIGNPVTLEGRHLVIVEEHRGTLPCPFDDAFHAGKRNTRIVDLLTNQTLAWSDLNIHMIEAHGFYEGRGAFFRVEPSKVVEILK